MDYGCSKLLNHGLNHGLFPFPFQGFWVEKQTKLNSPILYAQMAVLSCFLKIVIVLGMYNFGYVLL